MVYDGYVKYEVAEIHRSAIMQDFQDSDKKKKWTTDSHSGFFSVKFVMGYPCEKINFVLNSWSSHFAFLELSTFLQNSKWPLNGHFKIVGSQKLIRSLADMAEHISPPRRGLLNY